MIIGNVLATVRCDRCDRETQIEVNRAAYRRASDRADRKVDVDDLIDESIMNGSADVFYDGGRTTTDWVHLCNRCFHDPDVEDAMMRLDPTFAAEINARRAAEGQRVGRGAVEEGLFTAEEAAEMEDDWAPAEDLAPPVVAVTLHAPDAEPVGYTLVTVGPWTVDPDDPYVVESNTDPGDGHPHGTVCVTMDPADYAPEEPWTAAEAESYRALCAASAANARFIAAAPGLLALLDEWTRTLSLPCTSKESALFSRTLDAIAAARTGTSGDQP